MSKQNKQLAFEQYKSKWGLDGCRFFVERVTFNSWERICVCSKDCDTSMQDKSKRYNEVKSLPTLMKYAHHIVWFYERAFYGKSDMTFDNWKQFLEYQLIRKLSGV